MSTEITMPQLGETVTEGTVTRWLKEVGDAVGVDEPLLEVSTDKVDTEVPAPVGGTVLEILVPEDTTVPVGAPLARIGTAVGAAQAPGGQGTSSAAEGPPPAAGVSGRTPRHRHSPRVRRLSDEHGVNPDLVAGTGPGGRVLAADMLRAAGPAAVTGPDRPAAPPSAERPTEPAALAPPTPAGTPTSAGTPTHGSTLARAVAPAPVGPPAQSAPSGDPVAAAAIAAIAAWTTAVVEVDVTAFVAAGLTGAGSAAAGRDTFGPAPAGPAITAAVAGAALAALREQPSRTALGGLVRHLQVAAAGDEGSLPTVLREAADLRPAALARRIEAASTTAADEPRERRPGGRGPDRVDGLVLTLHDSSRHGVLVETRHSAPDLGLGVGIGAVVERPAVVRLDVGPPVVAVRSAACVWLTYDRRSLSPGLAGRVLAAVRERVEDPATVAALA